MSPTILAPDGPPSVGCVSSLFFFHTSTGKSDTRLADTLTKLPHVDVSKDPADNFLLAMAAAGQADYLVTGDAPGLLNMHRYQRTQIVTIRQIVELLER